MESKTVVAAVAIHNAAMRLGGRTIWRDVTAEVANGEFVAVLGPNGAGKSTLVKAILGSLPLAAGSVRVLGGPPGSCNAQIGYLPQRHSFETAVFLRGRDLVRLGLDGASWGVPIPLPRWLAAGARQRAKAERVDEVIELVGASDYADRPIGRLSGGEQQRLLIAQALVHRPQLLILDEPLDSLDLANQSAVAALVHQICRSEGVAVMLVAHDVNPILTYLDRVIYFASQTAVAGPPSEVITTETLSGLYNAPVEVVCTPEGRLVVAGNPEPAARHTDRHAR